MMCDVSSILKINGAKISIDTTISDLGEIEKSDIVFSDISVKGEITNIGDVLEANLLAEGKLSTLCARCAKEVSEEFSVSFCELLKNVDDDGTDKDDIVLFEGHTVDLAYIVKCNILLNIPTKYLCRPDCKGICAKCGKDLNEVKCNCEEDYINPQMEGLKKLLEERQEV